MDMLRLLIDTDGGSDDAVAVAMALRHPSCRVEGITTVAGNVSARQAAENMLTVLARCGVQGPKMYVGCERPLLKVPHPCTGAHGADGLGGLSEPQGQLPAPDCGVVALLSLLRENPSQDMTLVTLGPLTNLALALRLDPEAVMRLRAVYMMGSAGFGTGNITPLAEYNLWADAEAAHIVLEAGLPLTFIGWDACRGDCMLTAPHIEALRSMSALGRFLMDVNMPLIEMNKRRFGTACLDLADPAAMAAVLDPTCMRTYGPYHCEIDLSNGPGYGNLIIDRRQSSKGARNACVCTELHAERYFALLTEAMRF